MNFSVGDTELPMLYQIPAKIQPLAPASKGGVPFSIPPLSSASILPAQTSLRRSASGVQSFQESRPRLALGQCGRLNQDTAKPE